MLEKYLVRVFNNQDAVIGAGFLITKKHIITCAHVVNFVFSHDVYNSDKPTGEFFIDFPGIANRKIKVKIYKNYWYPPTLEQNSVSDIALLEIVESLPNDCMAGLFSTNNKLKEQAFYTHGFPQDANAQERISKGKITGNLVHNQWLQVEAENDLVGHHIQPGFSGAPAMLNDTDSIIGMVACYDNNSGKREGFIISSHLLLKALGLSGYCCSNSQIDTIIFMEEIFELKELIAGTEIPDNTLHSFFNKFLNSTMPDSLDLPSCLCFLAQKKHTSSSKAPLFEFLEYIHTFIKPESLVRLSDWKNIVAERLNLNLETIRATIKPILAKQQINKNIRPIIFLEIEPEYLTSTEKFRLIVSVYENEEPIPQTNSYKPCSIKELEISLPIALNNIQQSLKIDADIEVILPITLFNWNINNIPMKRGRSLTQPIGLNYSFRVRCWDRIRDYEKIYGHVTEKHWKRKWIEASNLEKVEIKDINCVSDNKIYCSDLIKELEEKALAFMPLFELSSFNDSTLSIFDTAIAAGLPFAFWIPQSQIDNKIRQEIENLLGLYKAEKWMEEIQAKKQQQEFWNNILVLWDNPELQPPKPDIYDPTEL
jgi:hypothetical protein